MTKTAYRADQTTLIDDGAGDEVLPGEEFWYEIEVTNNGSAAAVGIEVTDPIPAGLIYVTSDDNGGAWTIDDSDPYGTGIVATFVGTLASGGGSNAFWIRVQVE